jgi:hypothetical protein
MPRERLCAKVKGLGSNASAGSVARVSERFEPATPTSRTPERRGARVNFGHARKSGAFFGIPGQFFDPRLVWRLIYG